MSEGRCPSCGAPIRFSAGTAQIQICAHCNTVVARKGPALEAHGQVAAIVDTDSPLQLGARGSFEGQAFRIVGHLQKDHGAGPWDEWYAELEHGGGSAWLSESEGTWHWMTASSQPVSAERGGMGITFHDLRPGSPVFIGNARYVIEEVGTARIVSAEGELPDDLDPDAELRYADVTAVEGRFATLDFGLRDGDPELFEGKAVPLEALGIDAAGLRPTVRRAELVQARCPQCNGTLALRAPDRTLRVGCPFCGALLDASTGKLAFLQALAPPPRKPIIPLGARGKLAGTEWTCIAFLGRSCMVEGRQYDWDEYLLFDRARGFAWLMQANGHWTLLFPVAAGAVQLSTASAIYQGRKYRPFQQVNAITDFVVGECYWAVRAGEQSEATEYVAPPRSLNRERSSREVTFTEGEYLAPGEISRAFGKLPLPLPPREGIAPSQPAPDTSGAVGWAFVYSVAVLALFTVLSILSANAEVLREDVSIPMPATSGSPEAMHFASFETKTNGTLEISMRSGLEQDWLGLELDVVNEASGEVTSLAQELSYYSGIESGEFWSEGMREASVTLPRLPAGRYTLRVTPSFDKPGKSYQLSLRSDVPQTGWLILALIALWAWPIIGLIQRSAFETQRWQESTLQ